MTEAELQAAIIEACEVYGWLWHHETDSRRSNPGYPDLTIVKGNRVAMMELKSETGRVRPEQQRWLDALAPVDTFSSGLVRPRNLDEVIGFLAR